MMTALFQMSSQIMKTVSMIWLSGTTNIKWSKDIINVISHTWVFPAPTI